MSTNPTSFRLPFVLPAETEEAKVHPQVASAIRYLFEGLTDVSQAIPALNEKVTGNAAAVATVTKTVSTIGNVAGTPVTPQPSQQSGAVNAQPNLTPHAYTTAQSDFGGLILVNDASAFALTLNSGVGLPWYTFVYNIGAGTVTATPDAGTVNAGASISLTTGHFAVIFFDPNRNFWALIT